MDDRVCAVEGFVEQVVVLDVAFEELDVEAGEVALR